MKEINLHAALWAMFFLASWTFWLVYHNSKVSEYVLSLERNNSAQRAIESCLDRGFLFHAYPDRFGMMNVVCKVKDPPPIFATYKEYKRYMRAVGGG